MFAPIGAAPFSSWLLLVPLIRLHSYNSYSNLAALNLSGSFHIELLLDNGGFHRILLAFCIEHDIKHVILEGHGLQSILVIPDSQL